MSEAASAERSEFTTREIVLILVVYAAALCLLASFHEMWRDEIRAFSIARTSEGLRELFANLRNEGHPALWYLLLSGLLAVFPSPLALPLASSLVAVAAAFVFLRRAPFPRAAKILFLAGYYPLYEYSVICRNYGLGMLLLFLYLARGERRLSAPVGSAVLLALLANTSAFAWLVAVALSTSLAVEALSLRSAPTRNTVAALLLLTGGLVVGALMMWPERDTVVSGASHLTLSTVGVALGEAVVSQGGVFHDAFSVPFAPIVALGLVALYILLFRTPSVSVFLVALVMSLELFHRLLYPALALRHQGFLYLGVIAALWLDALPPIGKRVLPALERPRQALLPLGLYGLLLLQVYSGAKAIRNDLRFPLSSAPALAELVRSRPELRDAIIVSEPDFMVETLPYYLPNELHFPREGRSKQAVSFTTAAERAISLSSLLDKVSRLADERQQRVLVLLPPDVSSQRTLELLYGRSFTIDADGVSRLQRSASLIEVLDEAMTDENYSIWLVEPGSV